MMKNLVCVASVAALFLSEGTGFCMPPPSHIDLTKFPATQLDEIVVPLPSEVFNVLDKLGSPNWQEQLRDPVIRNTGSVLKLRCFWVASLRKASSPWRRRTRNG